eukprot:scaffold4662_cov79-Isochrysis_galbana.AAC.1
MRPWRLFRGNKGRLNDVLGGASRWAGVGARMCLCGARECVVFVWPYSQILVEVGLRWQPGLDGTRLGRLVAEAVALRRTISLVAGCDCVALLEALGLARRRRDLAVGMRRASQEDGGQRRRKSQRVPACQARARRARRQAVRDT